MFCTYLRSHILIGTLFAIYIYTVVQVSPSLSPPPLLAWTDVCMYNGGERMCYMYNPQFTLSSSCLRCPIRARVSLKACGFPISPSPTPAQAAITKAACLLKAASLRKASRALRREAQKAALAGNFALYFILLRLAPMAEEAAHKATRRAEIVLIQGWLCSLAFPSSR